MKLFIRTIGEIGLLFCLTYVAPALVVVIVTLDVSRYLPLVTDGLYAMFVGIMSFVISIAYVFDKNEHHIV